MSRLANLSCPRTRTGSKALSRRDSGSMSSMGWPLTLMRPRPCLAKAQAVAVFFLKSEEKEDTRKHQELDKIGTTRILATEPIVARRLLPLLRPPTPMKQPIPGVGTYGGHGHITYYGPPVRGRPWRDSAHRCSSTQHVTHRQSIAAPFHVVSSHLLSENLNRLAGRHG